MGFLTLEYSGHGKSSGDFTKGVGLNKKQIKKHILSQKDKKSERGWNEILVNQIKIKDVF